MRKVPRIALFAAGVAAAGAVILLAGPRVDTTYRPRPISLGDDLDAYLAAAEAKVRGITAGAEKKIVWADASHRRTPWSVVYLHGFSATRQETAPLCDDIARALGANLFYTRLTGHGLDGPALAAASVNDWLNDANEAFEIGRRLGERVLVVGTSTGGSLAIWLAATRPNDPASYVLISPNFSPKDHRARVLTWPWASRFVPAIFGATRQRSARTEPERRYWTSEYPTLALLPMMGLVKVVDATPLERVTAPVLVLYSRQDNVVDPVATEQGFARIGTPGKKLVAVTVPSGGSQHVIAGDIMAPENTASIAATILDFARAPVGTP